MIYVFENADNKASIVYDGDTLTATNKAKGIAIAELPAKNTSIDITAILKCNKSTGEVWWDYVPSNATPAEEQLQGEIDTLQAMVIDLSVASLNMGV